MSDEVAPPLGITPSALVAVWAVVAHSPSATYRELAQITRLSHPTVSRAMRLLIDWGKVTQQRWRVRGEWRYERVVLPPETIPIVPRVPRVSRDHLLEQETLRGQLRRERAAYAELARANEQLLVAIARHQARVAELLAAAAKFYGDADVG